MLILIRKIFFCARRKVSTVPPAGRNEVFTNHVTSLPNQNTSPDFFIYIFLFLSSIYQNFLQQFYSENMKS